MTIGSKKKMIAQALATTRVERARQFLLEQLDQAADSISRLELFRLCIGCDAIPWPNLLNKLIWDEDIQVTHMALSILGKTRDIKLKQAIFSVLDSDPEPNLQATALKALGEYSDEADIPLLLNYLKTDNKLVQAACIEALGNYSSSASMSILTRYSGARDENILKALIESFFRIGAVSELIKMLYSPNVTTALKLDAISRLKIMKDPGSVSTLIKLLSDRNIVIRTGAAQALGFADFSAVEPLIQAACNTPPLYRRIFVDSLTMIARKNRKEFAAYAEKNMVNKILEMAMCKLRSINHPELSGWVSRLLRMAPNSKDGLFFNISKVLDNKKEEDPLFDCELVYEILQNPDQDIRHRALNFYEKSSMGRNTSTVLLVPNEVLSIVIEVSGNIRIRECEKNLCHFLGHDDEKVIAASLNALASLRSINAEQRLTQLIAAPDVDMNIRIKAIDCAGRIGGKLMVHELVRLLSEEELEAPVRVAIIKALGECGIKWSGSVLRKRLNNDALKEKKAAIEALAKLRNPDDIDPIRALISNTAKPDINARALNAVYKLGGSIPLEELNELLKKGDKKTFKDMLESLTYHKPTDEIGNFLISTLTENRDDDTKFTAVLDTITRINEKSLLEKLFAFYHTLE